jgi:hypothetical protein
MLIAGCYFQEHSFLAYFIRYGCCRHQLLIRLLCTASPYPYPTFTSTFTNTHRLITRASLSRQTSLAHLLQEAYRGHPVSPMRSLYPRSTSTPGSSRVQVSQNRQVSIIVAFCTVRSPCKKSRRHRDQSPLAEPLYFFCEKKRREATLRMRNVGAGSFPALLIARWRSVHTCSHTYDVVVL